MDKDQEAIFTFVGICLFCVRQAERSLQSAIDTVLDDEGIRVAEQSELGRKQTLGDLLKGLKQRVQLPIRIKDKCYDFLRMRNQFVHEFEFDFVRKRGAKKRGLFSLSCRSLHFQ